MNDAFIHVPANVQSKSGRKPLYGIGVNDATYMIEWRTNGKRIECPFYRAWRCMFSRCYSKTALARNPSYVGCTVCDKWWLFSAFHEWMAQQDWEGKQLDKDVLVPGNKVYSPSRCIFVSQQINTLLTDQKGRRGQSPRGVSFHRASNKFRASVCKRGRVRHLGLFDTQEKASIAYREAKASYVKEIAADEEEPLRSALLRHSELFLKGETT